VPQVPFAKALAAAKPALAPRASSTAHPTVVQHGVHAKKQRDHDNESDHGHGKAAHHHGASADPLDPETRRFAQMAPPAFAASAPATPVDHEIAPRARVSMEELLPQLVKRIAWAGDKRRGSVQMELGSGPHAGTVVTVHADNGKVRVELTGDDTGALKQRLEAKGFQVER
jgi:hypothetical protein